MTASDAVYHKRCMTALYTRYRSHMRIKNIRPESIALAELISYIEGFDQMEDGINHIFKLSDLVKLYRERLEHLRSDASNRINSTRLKEKILAHIPDLEANKSNYGVVFSFKKEIGDALLLSSEKDSDSDAVVLMRVSQIIREEIF